MTSLLKRSFSAGIALAALAVPTLSVWSAAPASAASPVSFDIVINEVEANGGVPGDWIELFNKGTAAVDISGWQMIDNQDVPTASHPAYVFPTGTTIAAGGYLALDQLGAGNSTFNYGLGSGADSVRLFVGPTNLVLDPTSTIIDQFAWTSAATTTWGRCANGTGPFVVQPAGVPATTSATKGAANSCTGGGGGGGPTPVVTWPGSAAVTNQSTYIFGGNLSGLDYEPSGGATTGVLWGARNGPGALFRLLFNGTNWVPDSGDWANGKLLRYTDGLGNVDAEGVTMLGTSSAGGIFIASERDNNFSGTSRNSILRYNQNDAGTNLTATNDWNITADIPANGANLGLEAITFIPDSFLTSKGFFDEAKGQVYNPADYPTHQGGLFFVGVEQTGTIYAYELDQVGNGFSKVATIASGFPGVMDLQFDNDLGDLWVVCDDTCTGRTSILRINAAGRFVTNAVLTFERPATMPNTNNEGFAIAPATLCVGGFKPTYWSDDNELGGVSVRAGTLPCAVLAAGPDPVVPEFPITVLPVLLLAGIGGGWTLLRRRRLALALV
jgi:Lamin Tail Domain